MAVDLGKSIRYSGEQCKQLWKLLRISQAELGRRMGTNPITGYEYTVDNLRYWMSKEEGMPDKPFEDFLCVAEAVLQARIENIKRAEALRVQLEQYEAPKPKHPPKKVKSTARTRPRRVPLA